MHFVPQVEQLAARVEILNFDFPQCCVRIDQKVLYVYAAHLRTGRDREHLANLLTRDRSLTSTAISLPHAFSTPSSFLSARGYI